ncbi:MAG: hypothetical protein J5525_12600 [Lachnospiraceae bacterium]|nr:hypothetical protein [Lachnospiraceae bacterium]
MSRNYEIRLFYQRDNKDPDYCRGNEDVKKSIFCDTKEALIDKLKEVIDDFEGDAYAVWDLTMNQYIVAGSSKLEDINRVDDYFERLENYEEGFTLGESVDRVYLVQTLSDFIEHFEEYPDDVRILSAGEDCMFMKLSDDKKFIYFYDVASKKCKNREDIVTIGDLRKLLSSGINPRLVKREPEFLTNQDNVVVLIHIWNNFIDKGIITAVSVFILSKDELCNDNDIGECAANDYAALVLRTILRCYDDRAAVVKCLFDMGFTKEDFRTLESEAASNGEVPFLTCMWKDLNAYIREVCEENPDILELKDRPEYKS